MRKSKYLKTLILVMCLFLISCKTINYKQIQAISCTCNDTILQADKKLPIPPPGRIKNDSIDSYTTGNGSYTKYTYYLKEGTQKMIDYDLEGNVCIVVDNPMAAYNNEYPYSEWVIFHTNMSYSFGDSFENCSLSTPSNSIANVRVYPNPATDMVYIDPANTTVLKIVLFDISERIVLETSDSNKINITTLQSSTYLLKAHTNAGVYTQKIIVN